MSFEPNAMMELFRAEVETHSESLTSSLMALERDPFDASILESIMRSAHSLKGAARIVGVNIAVEVAHIMEDCLVAAQRGELAIKPNDIDVLLRGVDLLVQISEATKTDDAEWAPLEKEVHECVQQLKSIRAGQPIVPAAIHPPTIAQAAVAHEPPKSVAPEPTAEALTPEKSPTVQHAAIDVSPQPAVANKPAEPAVLTFGKTLDRTHAEQMRQALLAAVKAGAEEVRYDLSMTTDLDAVGLAFLAASKEQVQQLSIKRLDFSPVSNEIQFVLRMSGIASP
ncbi:MAG: Hpt domain-containing protein [Pirellulaceae bacterium]|nr:Hpt domain-containing protein [Pirellulaceae bacterium]